VAFALALAGPVLRRLTLSWRLLAGLLVLGLFGVLTRWEPLGAASEPLSRIRRTYGRGVPLINYDIPPELHHKAKVIAAHRGITLKAFVIEALAAAVEQAEKGKARR
jgi:hypothetical protein